LIVNRGQACIIIIAGLALALLSGSAARADNSRDGDLIVAHGSGLACFSIQPPAPTKDRATHQSCDRICAAKHAACVGLELNGAMNPALGCGTPNDPGYGGFIAECRCCAVEP
jgi:hypothetical protein